MTTTAIPMMICMASSAMDSLLTFLLFIVFRHISAFSLISLSYRQLIRKQFMDLPNDLIRRVYTVDFQLHLLQTAQGPHRKNPLVPLAAKPQLFARNGKIFSV